MPFEVKDWVVHSQHGVGQVVKLETREFAPGTARLYYEIALAKGTIWVPVDGSPSSLRKLTAKRDLAQYRGLLKSAPTALAADHRQRQLELTERLRQGTFRARCEVVRDLTAHGWRRPLGEGSAALLRAAHEGLDQEWAAAEGLSLSEAAQEVNTLLSEGRLLHDK
jgi:RNA polymerase-interacting CarD/CdnL/TRCF family regulator